METNTLIFIILFVIVIGILIFLISRLSGLKNDSASDKIISILQNQITELVRKQDETTKELNLRLKEQNESINKQLTQSQSSVVQQFAISQKSLKETSDSANKIIKEVTEKLTKLDETNKQVMNFAGQLQSLEKILKNPKQRGVLGEYFLETVLKNVLGPTSYKMQYKFKNGEIVDSVIFVKNQVIPIDAKFSLENYNRLVTETVNEAEKIDLEKSIKNDLKKRIEETSKYIRPAEGTTDFAFMFIPSEALYYDLLINKVGTITVNTEDLITFAFNQKRVVIVSPTTLLAYLQTVLQGLNALKIEESAQKILAQVTSLKNHLNQFLVNFEKVGKNLGTVNNSYNTSLKSIKSIDKDIFKITDENLTIEAEEVFRIDSE